MVSFQSRQSSIRRRLYPPNREFLKKATALSLWHDTRLQTIRLKVRREETEESESKRRMEENGSSQCRIQANASGHHSGLRPGPKVKMDDMQRTLRDRFQSPLLILAASNRSASPPLTETKLHQPPTTLLVNSVRQMIHIDAL